MFALLEHDTGADHGSEAGAASVAAGLSTGRHVKPEPVLRRERLTTIHWDLLVEVPRQELLATWRLSENPIGDTQVSPVDDRCHKISAERIRDHPRHFLEYEGPLRRAPGRVRRLDRGPAVVECLEGPELTVRLEGTSLRGRFEITHVAGGALVFRQAEE